MEDKSYSSVTVAKYLYLVAKEKNISLNITQIQKLLYILYGYWLSKYDYSILDETPKAWPYGPVFPKTQNIFKDNINLNDINNNIFDDINENNILKDAIYNIIENYGKTSAKSLTEWSHQKDSPWELTVILNSGKWNSIIEDNHIKKYFSNLKVL